MNTRPEPVQAHINRKAALANDTEAILREARTAEERLLSDPSLHTFVSHYEEGMLHAIPMIPDPM